MFMYENNTLIYFFQLWIRLKGKFTLFHRELQYWKICISKRNTNGYDFLFNWILQFKFLVNFRLHFVPTFQFEHLLWICYIELTLCLWLNQTRTIPAWFSLVLPHLVLPQVGVYYNTDITRKIYNCVVYIVYKRCILLIFYRERYESHVLCCPE